MKPKQLRSKIRRSRAMRGEIVLFAQAGEIGPAQTLTIQLLRAGEFTDMHGAEVAVTTDDLAAYVRNSNAYLNREQLPVEIGHPTDPGAPAAAWYRKFFTRVIEGVEWVCAEIELTAVGAEALAKNLYKYFSANLALDARAVVGGGFVNRPAVSGQQTIGSLSYLTPKGENMIELEMSNEEQIARVAEALREKYEDPLVEGDTMTMPVWVLETYADHVIVERDGDKFQIDFTWEGDSVVLGEPVPVAVEYVPADNAAPAAATNDTAPGGGDNMTNAEMAAAIEAARAQERAALAKQRADFDAQLAAARADERARVLAEQKRANEIRELANTLTAGPRALWHKPAELEALLGKLTDEDRAIVGALLQEIQAKGLVDLGEHGTQANGATLVQLPAFAQRALGAWLEKQGTVAEWFALNPELGNADQYDLKGFEK